MTTNSPSPDLVLATVLPLPTSLLNEINSAVAAVANSLPSIRPGAIDVRTAIVQSQHEPVIGVFVDISGNLFGEKTANVTPALSQLRQDAVNAFPTIIVPDLTLSALFGFGIYFSDTFLTNFSRAAILSTLLSTVDNSTYVTTAAGDIIFSVPQHVVLNPDRTGMPEDLNQKFLVANVAPYWLFPPSGSASAPFPSSVGAFPPGKSGLKYASMLSQFHVSILGSDVIAMFIEQVGFVQYGAPTDHGLPIGLLEWKGNNLSGPLAALAETIALVGGIPLQATIPGVKNSITNTKQALPLAQICEVLPWSFFVPRAGGPFNPPVTKPLGGEWSDVDVSAIRLFYQNYGVQYITTDSDQGMAFSGVINYVPRTPHVVGGLQFVGSMGETGSVHSPIVLQPTLDPVPVTMNWVVSDLRPNISVSWAEDNLLPLATHPAVRGVYGLLGNETGTGFGGQTDRFLEIGGSWTFYLFMTGSGRQEVVLTVTFVDADGVYVTTAAHVFFVA